VVRSKQKVRFTSAVKCKNYIFLLLLYSYYRYFVFVQAALSVVFHAGVVVKSMDTFFRFIFLH